MVIIFSFPLLTPGNISGARICRRKLEDWACYLVKQLIEGRRIGCEWSQGQNCKGKWKQVKKFRSQVKLTKMHSNLFISMALVSENRLISIWQFARVMNLARTGLRQGCCQGRDDVITKKLATDKWFFIMWLGQQLHALCFQTAGNANYVAGICFS